MKFNASSSLGASLAKESSVTEEAATARLLQYMGDGYLKGEPCPSNK